MISTLVWFPEASCTPLLLADTKGPTRPRSQTTGWWSRGVCVFSNQHSLQEVLALTCSLRVIGSAWGHVTPWEPMRPLGTSGVEHLAAPSWILTYYAARCWLLEWEKHLRMELGVWCGGGGRADRQILRPCHISNGICISSSEPFLFLLNPVLGKFSGTCSRVLSDANGREWFSQPAFAPEPEILFCCPLAQCGPWRLKHVVLDPPQCPCVQNAYSWNPQGLWKRTDSPRKEWLHLQAFAVEMPKGLILTCWDFIPKVKISLKNKFTQKHLGKLSFTFKHKIYPV